MKKKRLQDLLFLRIESMHKSAFISFAIVGVGIIGTVLSGHAMEAMIWGIPLFLTGGWAMAAAFDLANRRNRW